MSHSTVVVFFIVLVGICITHVGSTNCAGVTGKCIDGSYLGLFPYEKCDFLGRDTTAPKIQYNGACGEAPGFPPLPLIRDTCCIDCATLNKKCKRFPGSVGRSECCAGELQVHRPYPIDETPCCCCQYCDPNWRCLRAKAPVDDYRKKGFCITKNATNHYDTYDYCVNEIGGKVTWKWCKGHGCGCCHKK